MDFYNFYTGKEFEAYQYLGAHVWDGGTTFRTFAPAANRVSGSVSLMDGQKHL